MENRKKWSRIRTTHDKCEGWVPNHQFILISEIDYTQLVTGDNKISSDVISHICSENGILTPILLGSMICASKLLNHSFEGTVTSGTNPKSNIIDTAFLYLNAPYLKGGKTPFGIDSSGFTQMVYKINGYMLERHADGQSKQGEPLSFIEESEPGDLVFFDDSEGIINHVGIILKDNYIIHAHGYVRIDRLDHTGIFNTQDKLYTHKLRVIKKIL
jgi:hypothetical protein